MGSLKCNFVVLFCCLISAATLCYCQDYHLRQNQTAGILVDGSESSGRQIPDKLFGVFFEEINHAGAGGLWAELVRNRGFEAGGHHTPAHIEPWTAIGPTSAISVLSELSSCFESNKVALRMEVLCEDSACPSGGVGIYNPGFWGMNIVKGKTYKVVFYIRSDGPIDLAVSLTSATGSKILATSKIVGDASDVKNWTKKEVSLEAEDTDPNSRLQFTTTKKGVLWLDQVSAMPSDTHKGHGFRSDLMELLVGLEPTFIRFPGGCFVEGEWLRNAFRWKETVGPWEERPGHFGDVWNYWTDDGLGYYEFLQMAEDLGAAPVWVINNGISHQESVNPSSLAPFIQEMLDSIEFARGDASSKWGSVRAAMGHPEPFDLKYIAIGNEDCGKPYYRDNYMLFYNALKKAYPDIKAISNCDASSTPLDHPAELYDYHIYTSANSMFSSNTKFDKTMRGSNGPKAFVSEYAVTDAKDAGKGTLLAAVAEAAFLIGLERNSDIVEMASYAPLFVHTNDRRWNPDAIVFNSFQAYGTPSYWMQHFFKESSGATLLPSTLQSGSSASVVASAISWKSSNDKKDYITIKVVNFGSDYVNLKISVAGITVTPSTKTVLTSSNVLDENSFANPTKVVPRTGVFKLGKDMTVSLQPHSVTALDFLKSSDHIRTIEPESGSKSSI